MKISTLLETKVDEFCLDFKRNSRLFKMGREGLLTTELVKNYVRNLEYLFKSNCQHIAVAADLYQANPVLSNFFINKFEEENGHDQWARNDLKALGQESNLQAMSEMEEMVRFLELTLKTSPYAYISYMYFAEYMTAVLGPIWLELMKKNLGINSTQVTSLSKHVELDGDHASEVAMFLDDQNLHEVQIQNVMKFISEMAGFYNNFFNKLAERHESRNTEYQRSV